MNLLSRLKAALSATPPAASASTSPAAGSGVSWRVVLTEIGVTTPTCPCCGHVFEKMPQRKRACPQCRGVFYSRKRALDGVKVLLTEAQALDGEGQSALLTLVQENGADDADLNGLVEALQQQLGRRPTADELVEQHLLRLAKDLAASWKWGLYRNARFGLAESRARRGLQEAALRLLLEVNLIDLNGPRNMGSKDPKIAEQFPPFDPSTAMLAGGILVRTVKLMAALRLSLEDTRKVFESVASEVVPALQLPRSGRACWQELSKALTEVQDASR